MKHGLLRLLALALSVSLALILRADQAQGFDYWQTMFSAAPARFAYPASAAGVGEASHYLAERYWASQERAKALQFYQRAVQQGDAGAAYALSKHVPAKSEQWLEAAAELGDRAASLDVAARLQTSDPRRALALLEDLEQGPQRADLLARILLNRPELSDSLDWRRVAPDTPLWNSRRQVARRLDENPVHYGQQCIHKVSVYLQAPQARLALLDWLDNFYQHPLAQLDFCFTLLDHPDAADCTTQEGRVDCWARDVRSEYRWFIAERGVANARANELHLPVSASFRVLAHELGHWFGLADEYEMREPLASAFCEGRYRFDAQNLIVTAGPLVDARRLEEIEQQLPWRDSLEQPIASKINSQLYRLGSQDTSKVGLFRAATCDGTMLQAWKPVASVTFMEHHDIGEVPSLYLDLMKARRVAVPTVSHAP